MANPHSRPGVWIGIGLVGAVVVGLSYVLITGDGPPIVREGIQAVRDFATTESVTPPATDPVAGPVAQPTNSKTKPTVAAPRQAPQPAPARVEPAPVAAVERLNVRASGLDRNLLPHRPVPPLARRTDFYLPGNVSGWTTVDVMSDQPLHLRAAGVLMVHEDSSGPEGVRGSAFERGLERGRRTSVNERVVAAAPYLALIGRVCKDGACSAPFAVGASRLVCPSEFSADGRLQLWTNNYVVVDGIRTLNRFSTATGGYAVYAEPAPHGACGASPEFPTSPDVVAIREGQVVKRAEFTVSSSQVTWKPFFVPLTTPLRVRASGMMQPGKSAEATGPEGIRVPVQAVWTYPGMSDLVVDRHNRLYDQRFPYQALIGRLCSGVSCGETFFVGREFVICGAENAERLELWVNHIVRPEGMLAQQLPVSMKALEMQGRHGDYRFEISGAPAGACSGS